jgi:hypothetical protein
MALLGNAAMLLWYDIVPEAMDAHDAWHTREHFPERVGIPGFLRAQRWVAKSTSPHYFVVYEVADIAVLSDKPYMERLNNPSAWTSRMMPNFRGMTRGFCNVERQFGTVLGTSAVTIRFTSDAQDRQRLDAWLNQTLSTIVERDGITSAHLLRSAVAPVMTTEQSIRGRDAGVDRVVLVTGYTKQAVFDLTNNELSTADFETSGAGPDPKLGLHELVCLADRERP